MAFEDLVPYFGFIAASFALSCLSTVCLFRQRSAIQQLQQRITTVEQRPLQQIQVLAQDTGYGQAYQPVPSAPPMYYLPPAPTTAQYRPNVV